MKLFGKSPFSLIIICLMLLLLVQTLVGFAVVIWESGSTLFGSEITFAEADALMLESMYANQTVILLISDIFILLALWWMAKRRKQSFGEFTDLALSSRKALMVLAAAAGLAAAFWGTIAVNIAPWPEEMIESYVVESAMLTSERSVVDFLAVVIAVPLVEELLFRGIIYRSFCQLTPAGLAVVFQGMLFASVHGTFIWMLYAFFLGCILGYVRKRTGSVRPCILMHVMFNASSYLFDLFSARYAEDMATVTFVFIASAFVLLLCMYGISFRTDSAEENHNP